MDQENAGQRDRERKVVEIVRHFLLAFRTFRQIYEEYQKGSLCFSGLAKLADDRGQSILFALKEDCHSLFRRNETGVSEKEQIFDLTIGTLFHMAMKMREDLYQLEFYGPKVSRLSENREGPQEKGSLIPQFQGLLSRAKSSLKEGMEEMDLLLMGVLPQFQNLLREYRENGLLIRFFLEEKDLLREVWGERAWETLLEPIYGADPAQPDRLAGESYFQSAFYPRAAQAFSRALEKNPADEEVQFMHHLSQGMEQFYSFAPLPALKSFEKCLSLGVKKEFLERYRERIYNVCRRVEQEFPGRRKSDVNRDLAKKAKALQRQLDKMIPPRPVQPKS
jgi:tetratricopeptide (TPR) repeat protein